ncbi:MAG: VCBS repeat-containing protein, partial [Myxococcaceae bacterium]|nr:VCBS repeat-containing protein [Myxococcaceae bacterium]
CVCPTGATLCGGLCVPENSPTACGFRCLSCTAAAGPNAVATCVNGACDFTCQPGFHRCGSRCVSNFDPATCGQRCDACPMPANATAICDGTSCGFTCAAGFHRCGSGCVSNFDVATCGNACTPCPTPANAVAVCRSATPGGPPACAFECNPGFVRCGNQCRPESATACGASCATCTPPAGATNPQCVSGQCQYTCAAGFHQCGTQCVPDTSVASCGTRCTACPTTSFGVATCDGTSCGIRCNTGYHECNGQCVWNFSVSTCGSRCTPCPAGPPGSGTTVTCDGTSCGLQCGSSVTPNFCNNACVANSVTTCGSTCQTCTAPANASPVCTSGVCGFTCNTGFHRCGAQCLPDDSPDSCGTSCSPCPPGPANTTPTCTRATTTSPYTCGWACGAGTNRCPANGDDCVPPDYSLGCGATCAVCSAGTSLERGVCGTNGICSVACINRCNNACVNVQTSAAHCGACGTGCASTDRCSMGECRAFCASGVGLGSLLPAVTVSSSSFPFVVVDVNGDGRNDLVAAEGTVLTVRLGNVNAQGTGPSGTFSPSPTSSTSLFYVPTQLVAGDLTGDGRPELVLLSTASVAEVLRNNGSGGFVRYTVSTSGVPTSATIGDFLGGGQPDLLLGFDTISTAASATLYPGVTTTTSSPVGSAVPANLGIGSVSGVRVATVTADALPDLVTAAAAKALFVFPGTGASNAPFNGAGGTSVQLPGNETFTGPGGGTFFPFEVADVTADGISDVVVPSVDGATTGVRVFPLTATPAFGASVSLATPASVRALALADVNGDGRRDVIVASSDVRVFLSQSGNAFSAAQVLGIAFSATFGNSLAAVDTTGDGRPELHTPSGSTLVTALNSGAGSFPAVQGAAAPTATRIAVGDLNGDGLSDVAVSSPRMGTGPIVGASTRLVN